MAQVLSDNDSLINDTINSGGFFIERAFRMFIFEHK